MEDLLVNAGLCIETCAKTKLRDHFGGGGGCLKVLQMDTMITKWDFGKFESVMY